MKSIKCPICGEVFTSEQEFRKHFNSHVDNIVESAEDDFDKELTIKEMEDIADRFEALINEINEFNKQNKAYGYGFDINIDKSDDDTDRIALTLIQNEEDECDLDCDDCEKVCDSFKDTLPSSTRGKRAVIGAVDETADLTEEEKNDFESFLESFLNNLPKSKKITVDNVDISDAADYFISSPLAHIDIMQSIFDEDKFFNSVREVILKYAETKGLENLSEDEELRFVARIMAELNK